MDRSTSTQLNASSTTRMGSSTQTQTQTQTKKEYKIISLQDFSRNTPLIEILNKNELITLEDEAIKFLKKERSKNREKQLLIIEIDKLSRKERAILPTGA